MDIQIGIHTDGKIFPFKYLLASGPLPKKESWRDIGRETVFHSETSRGREQSFAMNRIECDSIPLFDV